MPCINYHNTQCLFMSTINPLLEKATRINGHKIRLPSGGLFYDDTVLDPTVVNGELYVYPMSAVDEINIRNPDKLLDGSSIADTFKKCIPGIRNPYLLFAKDVDYLLMALRMVSHGDEITMEYNHECKPESKKHSYAFSVNSFMASSKGIDPSIVNDAYKLTLDNGQQVELRPLRFKDSIQIMESFATNTDNSYETKQMKLLQLILATIESVDGITDRAMINEWGQAIPRSYIGQIALAFEKHGDWGPATSKTVKCRDCSKDISFDLPLNPIVFFT